MERRTFLKNSSLALAASAIGAGSIIGQPIKPSAKPKIKKCLKIEMVKEGDSILDKFKLLKELGYDGVEFSSPHNFNNKEILEAKAKTGLEIPGVVNSEHWKSPISSPDAAVRDKCYNASVQAMNDCKLYGGTTMLLVAGIVNDKISYADAYTRGITEIKRLIPHAEKTGIKIAIENVWNNFLVSPLEAARFVDEINHPLVGWYFDIGNILRYGWPEQWIEILGKRIMKLDVKEYSRKKQNDEGLWKGFDVELMDGDNNWPVIIEALEKISYNGWASAEVPGGNKERLKVIIDRMNKIFG
ncbi:MAG: sugar phosphate isomerase/epimerase [Chitinophagaceae bacterium]|nr:sugar phosphate isomerase/epimerase [Chitinophagaceae bacterium]MCW5926313.1 sugar phosphate isomerase/epimerase [Chitinophagaceae bacterium]